MHSIYHTLLQQGAARFGGDKTLYFYENHPYSYAEVLARCERRAAQLTDLGLTSGDTAVLALPDCIELAVLFYALIKLDVKPLCISELNRRESILHYAQSARAAVLFLDSADEALLASFCASDPGVRILTVHTAGDCDAAPVPSLETGSSFALPLADPGTAYLTATSGSSGRPKIIPNRHDRVMDGLLHFAVGTLGIRSDDLLLSASKMSYTYGLANNMLTPALTGAAALLFRSRAKPQALCEQSQSHSPTVFFAVPATFRAILQDETCSRMFRSERLRLCLSSGDALPGAVARDWQARFGLTLTDATGCSEAGCSYLLNRNTLPSKVGSAGLPLPGFSIRLAEEDGTPAQGHTGVLWVKGSCTASCYLHAPEATARKFRDGWVVTNDVFKVDSDGYYWFEGRSDHLFKLNGLWVSGLEIRDALLESPLVSEAEILKIHVGQRDRMTAFVTLSRPCPGYEAVLQGYLRQRLSKYKCPWRICAVEQMPRTLSGKTDKHMLCAWFRSQMDKEQGDSPGPSRHRP